MLSLPGRNGRRRRVLNEEVLSASSSHVALRAMSDERESCYSAPRYSDAAGVENHPQVTDFIPRHYGTIALLVGIGILTTAALGALHYFALPIAVACGFADAGRLELSAAGSLASWIAAVVLVVAAATCLLVYSIRRHRIDDYRGRYRVWLAAAAACVVLSADSVTGLHSALAQSLSHHTGWVLLRDGAIWWLAIAGLPLSWIAVRALLDLKECRVAVALLAGSMAAGLAAGASFFGLLPAAVLHVETLTTGAGVLLADWLLLAAVVSYARFVVLDAQGLIPIVRIRRASKANEPRAKASAATPAPGSTKPSTKLATSIFVAAGRTPSKSSSSTPPKSASSTTHWTDGRRAERDEDDYDDDSDGDNDDRKLSKSDRKRLRKLKARNRAA